MLKTISKTCLVQHSSKVASKLIYHKNKELYTNAEITVARKFLCGCG